MATRYDSSNKGFAYAPTRAIAPAGGLTLYRAWGGTSSEWGSGYFSLEKPSSVLDAELRFNIADWGNSIHFVTTFRLNEGCAYLHGPVAHGVGDMKMPATQVYVESPFLTLVEKLGRFEVLKHDVTVVASSGMALLS